MKKSGFLAICKKYIGERSIVYLGKITGQPANYRLVLNLCYVIVVETPENNQMLPVFMSHKSEIAKRAVPDQPPPFQCGV